MVFQVDAINMIMSQPTEVLLAGGAFLAIAALTRYFLSFVDDDDASLLSAASLPPSTYISLQAQKFAPRPVAIAKPVHARPVQSPAFHVGAKLPRAYEVSALAAATPLASAAAGDGASGEQPSSVPTTAQSTVSQSSINLTKNIVGAGILSLPGGIAALSDSPTVLLPATVMLAVMCILSGYCFSQIGQACKNTQTDSYAESWKVAVGSRYAWVPRGVCTAKSLIGCLAYSMILADSFSAIFSSAGLPALIATRNATLWLLTASVVLPLCLLRSFAALAPFSSLGITGVAVTTAVMGLRFFQGAYAPGGQFYGDLSGDMVPTFNTGKYSPISAFVLLSMASSSFIAHVNAPKYMIELENPTVPRYNRVVSIGFLSSLAVFILAGAFGFLTFGGASKGMILLNFSLRDPLATVGRICTGLSILFAYPLCFDGFRKGVLEFARGGPVSQGETDRWTVGLVTAITLMAMVVKDLGFLMSFSGAFFGALVAYILPALMALGAEKKGYAKGSRRSRWVNRGVVGIGAVLMVLGSVISVLSYFTDLL